jgi:hypothetical protein
MLEKVFIIDADIRATEVFFWRRAGEFSDCSSFTNEKFYRILKQDPETMISAEATMSQTSKGRRE